MAGPTTAAWGLILWLLYKVLQTTVATGFAVIIISQAAAAGLVRLFGEPAAVLKVQEAQRARSSDATGGSHGSSSSGDKQCNTKPTAGGHVTASATDASHMQPRHVVVDSTQGHTSEAWQQIGPYMRKYGRHAIANSQLFNPEFIHFFLPGVGSIAYIVADLYNRAVVVAVGDPLAPEAQWRGLTSLFVKEFPEAYFYHSSQAYASVLQDMGYWVNDVGAETTLQVQSWAYNGKTRTVRAAARAARESGVRVRELDPEDLTDELRQQLQHDVSGDWLQQKAVADRELRVFVRHVDYDNMQLHHGVRLFVAEAYDPQDAPPAFVDEFLQGAALNAKPPKPPRSLRSSASLKSQASLTISNSSSSSSSVIMRSNSVTSQTSLGSPKSTCSSCSSGASVDAIACLKEVPAGAAAAASEASSKVAARAAAPAAVAAAAARGEEGPVLESLKCTAAVSFSSAEGFAQLQQPQGEEQHQGQQGEQQPAAAGAARQAPELVGFILLDPLWEDGQEVGYVTSLVRMKRSAHSGTLKLLYEDIISCLRQEGRQELAFGFAPFFNLRDHCFRRCIPWIRWMGLYLYHCGNNVYAFKNLAFSKTRYGAGVTQDGSTFRDPDVTMSHIYMASKHHGPGWNILDLYVLCMFVGFMGPVWNTLLKLTGATKGGANLTAGATRTGR